MKGYHANIEQEVLNNDNFRKVVYTGKNSQLVLMSLKPNQEIGSEIHPENDQFFRIESGEGIIRIDEASYDVRAESAVIVPAGSQHNVINTSDKLPLKFYTIYSPPHHKDGIIHKTKEQAEENDQDFDGILSE